MRAAMTAPILFAPLAAPSAAAATADEVAANLDVVWVFAAAVLVFLMQAGFALLGAGALRAKNTVNYLMKSVMDFGIGALVFFAVGFALMFGAGNRFIGREGFGLGGATPDGGTLIFFLFQVMFAATAATIVAGAVAERMKLGVYVVYTIAITAVIYPIYGHWMWGGGFLADIGALDFAGSGVVHAVGGLLALVAATILGPRIGRYDADGRLKEIKGHSATFVVLGTLLLFFGWFGFNTGSTLSAGDGSIPLIAVNTFLAGCAGAVLVFTVQFVRGTTKIGSVCNGALSGLVAITAPCYFVAPWAAMVIGAAGGVIYLMGQVVLDHVAKVDDPVGAIPVHGFNGLFGLVALGIFATENGARGLIIGGAELFLAQIAAAAALLAWTLGTGYALFKGLDVLVGLRVSPDEERRGLDDAHHGGLAYPELSAVLGVAGGEE
jgi:Amt family ammonium transporter